MPPVSVNYLAVLACAVLSMVIGGAWFSPGLFGKTWMAGIGKTKEQLAADYKPVTMVWAFLSGAVMALTLAVVVGWAGADSWLDGARVGLYAGLGLVGMATGANLLFEGRSLKLYLVLALHDVVTLALMGAILGAWR